MDFLIGHAPLMGWHLWIQPSKQSSRFFSLEQSSSQKKAFRYLVLLILLSVGPPRKCGTAQTELKDGLFVFCKAASCQNFVYVKPMVLSHAPTSGSSTAKSQRQYKLRNALYLFFLPGTVLEEFVSVRHSLKRAWSFCHRLPCVALQSTSQISCGKLPVSSQDFPSRSWHIRKKFHWAKPQKATSLGLPEHLGWFVQRRKRNGRYSLWGIFFWDSPSSL